jgi:ABC-type dipeptide/oligopeptide/nickel transport system permease component
MKKNLWYTVKHHVCYCFQAVSSDSCSTYTQSSVAAGGICLCVCAGMLLLLMQFVDSASNARHLLDTILATVYSICSFLTQALLMLLHSQLLTAHTVSRREALR